MSFSSNLLNRLYRCAVVLCSGLCLTAVASVDVTAQELIPTPPQEVDASAADPFADDANGFRPIAPAQPGIIQSPIIPAPMHSNWNAGGSAWFGSGTLDRLHSPLLRRDLQILGAQSCATSNCHGGPRPGVSQPWVRRGSEYQLWNENDPHAQSWRTICSDESVAIMQRLKIMDGDQIVDQVGFDNCLACHNTTQRYNEPRTVVDRREGVGCAACHGPAEKWASTHFQRDWSPLSAQDEGFVNAADLYTRARMCASCHVGDKDRDMNHDIIAAGHPSLRYEMATFHAWQPKHWRDAEADDKTFYEAQLWLAGQVAATDASLALLETRAADAHTVSEWPEFASYNCASCHHNLGLDNDRQPIDPARRATAIYSQWNDAGLRWLIQYRQETGQATDEDFRLVAALDQVENLMETATRPDADSVAVASRQAREELAAWFDGGAGIHERNMFRSDRLAAVITSAAGKPRTFATWESAVQFYLAAVAARESWPGGWNGPLRDVANQMQHGLRYPEMIDISRFAKWESGSGPTASRYDVTKLGVELAGWLGPVQWMPQERAEDDVDPAEIEKQIEELLEKITQRWKDEPPPTTPEATVDPNMTDPNRVDETKKPDTPDRESVEDIRKALEALQSGTGDSDE